MKLSTVFVCLMIVLGVVMTSWLSDFSYEKKNAQELRVHLDSHDNVTIVSSSPTITLTISAMKDKVYNSDPPPAESLYTIIHDKVWFSGEPNGTFVQAMTQTTTTGSFYVDDIASSTDLYVDVKAENLIVTVKPSVWSGGKFVFLFLIWIGVVAFSCWGVYLIITYLPTPPPPPVQAPAPPPAPVSRPTSSSSQTTSSSHKKHSEGNETSLIDISEPAPDASETTYLAPPPYPLPEPKTGKLPHNDTNYR